MYYSDILQKLKKDEKNPINQMYLNEIQIKWDKVEKAMQDAAQSGDYAELAAQLSDFTAELGNAKFYNTKNTKGGFKSNCPLFDPAYLDDLLTLLIQQSGIMQQKGLHWGWQTHTVELCLNPQKYYVNDKDRVLTQKPSARYLSLVQSLDLQYRQREARNFNKAEILFPILLFSTHKVFTEADFIQFAYDCRQAVGSYNKANCFVVTEYMEAGFNPDLSRTQVDGIFVLRKQHTNGKKNNGIMPDVINALHQKIYSCLFEEEGKKSSFRESGTILRG